VVGKIQDSISTYLSQITLINAGLGMVVTVLMWLLGMPTPLLWGVLAMLFNFIPYVGALAATGCVFLAAFAHFGEVWLSVGYAFAFWLATAVEGQLVTPSILGRTLRAGPLVVLVAVAFWGYLWGIAGVFVAVPMLIAVRHACENFESTYPVAVILGAAPKKVIQETEQVEKDQPIGAAVESS